jgi:hypothetical protein
VVRGKAKLLDNGCRPLIARGYAVAVTPEIHLREIGKELGFHAQGHQDKQGYEK